MGRSNACIFSGNTEENLIGVLADYEAAIEANFTNAEVWLGLADAYIRMSDYNKALEVLREGLEKDDGSQRITDKIAEIKDGNISNSQGKMRWVSDYDKSGKVFYYYEYNYLPDGKTDTATSYGITENRKSYVECAYKGDEQQTKRPIRYPHDGTLAMLTPTLR